MSIINLNDATPAAPAGYVNVKWQADSGDPRNVSAYVVAGIGGVAVSGTAPTNGQFLKLIGGVWTPYTFLAADISDLSSIELVANKDANNGYAGLNSSGFLKAAEFPAYTGDVQKPAGGVATTVIGLQGTLFQGTPVDGQVPVFVSADGKIEWQTLFGGGGSTGGTRNTQSKTTASLANGAIETGSIALNKSLQVYRVTVNKAARLRLYATAAHRTADTAPDRPNTVPPTPGTQHGVIADFYLDTSDKWTYDCSPPVDGANLDGTPTNAIYYALTNLSGSTGTVTFTITFVGGEV